MSTKKISVVVSPKGEARFVYNEELDLALLGAARVERASHVEPVDGLKTLAYCWVVGHTPGLYGAHPLCRQAVCAAYPGTWWADLTPVEGPVLGPFTKRSEALAAEAEWLEANVILKTE